MPPQGLTNFNDTGLSMTLRYGTGVNYVTGDIGIGAFQLDRGEFAVAQQAYLQGTSKAGEAADFPQGQFGILGLGFDTPGASSFLDTAAQTALGATSTAGQFVLSNIFAHNPDQPDYIGIALSRNGNQEGTADGSLTTTEYDNAHGRVVWSLRLDSLSAGGTTAGKDIVLLDTGTTNILIPEARVTAIYSSIPGAVLQQDSTNIPLVQFRTTTDVWVVPCTTQVDVAAAFGGQILTSPDGTHNFTVCFNSFTGIGTIAGGEVDALFGDNFLWNVYAACVAPFCLSFFNSSTLQTP
ncbi:aspartic peptidase domain-containing protein [Mycena galopus ATCC 62051]|nr:aspartic peptidase domain-containing protein [Mycena galopus ATCC 62051]